MAHKHEKQEAIRLFEKGWGAEDIAAELSVSVRNIYRWLKQYRDSKNNDNPQQEQLIEPAKFIEVDTFESTFYPSKSWLDAAENLTKEHAAIFENYRIHFCNLLNQTIEAEPNHHNRIDKLYSLLHRCIEGERKSVGLDMLDVNRAFELLQKRGFYIPSENTSDG